MKTSKPKNMAASVRARLMNVSKASGEDFAYVLILLPAEHDAPLVVHTKRLLARTCWA